MKTKEGLEIRNTNYVQRNRELLDSCVKPHVFVKIQPSMIVPRYRCCLCQGEITGEGYRWYEKGLQDAWFNAKPDPKPAVSPSQ